MKNINIELVISFDDTQCTKDAMIKAVNDILNVHGEGCYFVSDCCEKEEGNLYDNKDE